MRFAALLAASFLLAFPASSFAREALPVYTRDGHGVVLSDVSAKIEDGVVNITGWARRDRGSYSPLAADLRVELLGANDQVLAPVEASWDGALHAGVRRRHAAIFRVQAPVSDPASVSGVRVTIVDRACADMPAR